MKAIVIGGGIGGLTAANALEKAGIEAHVYERAPELREVGAGISLWANAIHALDAIGLGGAIRARGLSGVNSAVRTWNGKVLQAASYEELARRFGAAIVLMHRGDLLAVLASELKPERLHLNNECTGFRQEAAGVTARFTNGGEALGDALIGADGLRSAVRNQLFAGADGPPRYAGYTAWRAVVQFEDVRASSGETWGCGRRFGIVPLSDGRVYWFATQNEREGANDPPGETKRHLSELFGDWHHPIPALIEASDESAILRNDIYDREPATRWGEGCVTLLGDAAHPMTPNLGQGACQAIEDAITLAVCLQGSGNIEARLREYERRRIPRTREIVLRSRRLGEIGQWENNFLCWFRNAGFRAMPAPAVVRQMDSVAGFDVVAGKDLRV